MIVQFFRVTSIPSLLARVTVGKLTKYLFLVLHRNKCLVFLYLPSAKLFYYHTSRSSSCSELMGRKVSLL